MFNSNNTSATFTPNTDTTKKAIGSGILSLAGVQIQYSVFSSGYKPSGILVSLPSKALYVDNKVVKDQNGRIVYDSLVSISDPEINTLIDEAVINAMANKGVYLANNAQQAKAAGQVVNKVIESTPSTFTSKTFANPEETQSNTSSNNTTKIPESTSKNIQESTPRKINNSLPF